MLPCKIVLLFYFFLIFLNLLFMIMMNSKSTLLQNFLVKLFYRQTKCHPERSWGSVKNVLQISNAPRLRSGWHKDYENSLPKQIDNLHCKQTRCHPERSRGTMQRKENYKPLKDKSWNSITFIYWGVVMVHYILELQVI